MIAVVEDDPIVISVLKSLFGMYELELHEIDLEEVFEEKTWVNVGGVVVDLMLGRRFTGIDVLRYLRSKHPHIRTVVLTAMQSPPGEAYDYADAVLIKPSDPDEIIGVVSPRTVPDGD